MSRRREPERGGLRYGMQRAAKVAARDLITERDGMKLGTETGSLINHVMANSGQAKPEVGMGCTIFSWTDRHAATIITVSPSGKTVKVQRDIAKRTDTNGMSEVQSYEYSPDPEARVLTFRLTKKGWRSTDTSGSLGIGFRKAYHDYSF